MNKGILFAISTALISGFSVFIAKILVAKIDPLLYTTIKNTFVTVALSVWVFTNPYYKQTITKLTRNDWKYLLLIGVLGGSVPFALFFVGLSLTTATGAALIHKTLFIWIALFALSFLKEKLSFFQMLGYVFILWAVLANGNYSYNGSTGEWMIALATLLWAIENVIAKKKSRHIPGTIIAWARMSFGLPLLMLITLFSGKAALISSISVGMIPAIIVASILLTGYVITYYSSLNHIPVTLASSLLVIATPITALLEYGFAGKTVSTGELISFTLLALGTFTVVYFRSYEKKKYAGIWQTS